MTYHSPDLRQKLDRLFAYFHRRNDPELTTVEVATMATEHCGTTVSPTLLDAARSGAIDALPPTVADALCDVFGVDRDYLRLTGGRDIDIDQRLRLWTAIRDRGLQHFAARAADLSRDDLEHLIDEVNRFPVDEPH
ncbi:hypothetical protein [Rhodococcus gannanensis]|uniref:XRE family transcriptional regulator n=1 Tax=Rhodococcus gannanensis TaxID=1960308 RepID=A0ABW4P2A8_9NOCA